MTTEANPAPLSLRERLAYGCGDMASNLFYQVFNLFLLYYYTDVVGLEASAVGTMFFVTRFLDAFKNPVVGLLADRTETRWGKFRPWILWGAVPYGIGAYLVFLNPSLSGLGKLVYAYASYVFVTLTYAVINVPYAALMGVMSPSPTERTTLASFRFAFAFGGGIVVTSTLIPLKNLLGGGDDLLGFRLTIALFAVLAVALLGFTFACTRERVKPVATTGASVTGDLRALLRNEPWLVLFIVAVGTLSMVAVRNAATVYYFKYYMGGEKQASLCLTLGMVGQLIGCLLARPLLRLGSKERVLACLIGAVAPATVALFWVPREAYGTVLALHFFVSLLMGPKPVLVWSMYADTADYGELKEGRRTTGLIFAAANFANGIGLAVGGALGGWLLTWFGFVANTVQSEQALLGIRLMFSIIPGLFAAVSAVALLFYPMNETRLAQIGRDLARAREKAAAKEAGASSSG